MNLPKVVISYNKIPKDQLKRDRQKQLMLQSFFQEFNNKLVDYTFHVATSLSEDIKVNSTKTSFIDVTQAQMRSNKNSHVAFLTGRPLG